MATSPAQTEADSVIEKDLLEFLQASRSTQNTLIKNSEESKRVWTNLDSILTQVARNNATIAYQEGTAKLETQNATRAAVKAAIINPTDGADLILDSMNRLREANKATVEQAAKVAKMHNTSLWDDPGQFIKDNFLLPMETRKLEGALLNTKVLDNRLGATAQAVDSTQKIYAAQAELITKATIEARTQNAAADALLKADELKLQGLRDDTASINAILNAHKDRINALHNFNASKDSNVRLQLSIDEAADRKEHWTIARADKLAAGEAKAEAKTVDEINLRWLNNSRLSRGALALTAQQYSTYAKLPGNAAELAYDLNNGMGIEATGGKSRIAGSPMESLDVVREFSAPGLSELRQTTLAMIQEVEKSVLKTTPRDKNNKNIVDGTINKAVYTQLENESKNIKSSSVLHIGDLSSYLGSADGERISQIANLSLVQKVFHPLIAAKVPLNDTAQILGYVTSALAKNQISSNEASQIVDIYRTATEVNSIARGFNAMGIVLPNNGTKYQIKVGGFLSSDTVDLRDYASVSNYFVRQLAGQMSGMKTSAEIFQERKKVFEGRK